MFGVRQGRAVIFRGIRASCLKDRGYKRRAQVQDKTATQGNKTGSGGAQGPFPVGHLVKACAVANGLTLFLRGLQVSAGCEPSEGFKV
jgi:hypothetical protein